MVAAHATPEHATMSPSPARSLLAAASALGTAWTAHTTQGWRPASAGPEGGATLGRMGHLEVRLAAGPADVRRAQRVRFKVFFEEGSARADAASALRRRDLCGFDSVCDHLVVVDHAAPRRRFGGTKPKIVGTYRLLRQDVAERHGGFYTAGEFDIGPLLARHPDKRFLELGRASVLPRYRSKRTIELLWRGIWAYAQRHRVDVLIGCASLDGVDVEALREPLGALRHLAAAPPEWQASPLPGRGHPLPTARALDRREALARLPPLIKGYLRAGARFADGAVVDLRFNTTDVLAVMPLADLQGRYVAHFGSA